MGASHRVPVARLGLSCVSLEAVDAAIEYSARTRVPLMLVASRNQVECAELGGGYVRGMTPGDLVKYVRHKSDGGVLVCRDHGGPYLRDDEADLPPEEAVERALVSLDHDVRAGFQLVHLDCGRYPDDRRELLGRLADLVTSTAARLGCHVGIEVGTEDNDGVPHDLGKFTEDVHAALSCTTPDFVVGQTGSLVRETFQVGYFDFPRVRELVSVAHSLGVAFKEHNCDYSEPDDIEVRALAGVDAMNIGPELGVLQTTTVIRLAHAHGLDAELTAFLAAARQSGNWRKWRYAATPSAWRQSVIAGHYAFDSDPYLQLVGRLADRAPVRDTILDALLSRIDRYVKRLTGTEEGSAAAASGPVQDARSLDPGGHRGTS